MVIASSPDSAYETNKGPKLVMRMEWVPAVFPLPLDLKYGG
jgi:hypothetical protein